MIQRSQNKRLRVAFFTSWDVPCGIAQYSAELVGALQQYVDVHVIPIGPQVWRRMGLPMSLPSQRRYIRDAAQQAGGADIAHVQFQYPFFGGLRPDGSTFPTLLAELDMPVVVTIHELDLRGTWMERIMKGWLNQWLLKRKEIACFIVHNRYTGGRLLQLGVEKERIKVIPMWVPRVHTVLPTQEARRRLGITCKYLIGAFGFIVRRRGYYMLLDALEPFPDDTMLVLAGGKHPLDHSNYYEALLEYIRSSKWADRIHVTGYIADERLPLWLSAFDFVVAPYVELSDSASLLRCIAYGKPIVTSDLPPLRELHQRAKCLHLFRTGDTDDLRRAIYDLLHDEQLRHQLTLHARQYASSHRVERPARQTLMVYERVLGIDVARKA